jgi:hypothetical protein
MVDRMNHAVWSVYDLYRTARLNVKYYSTKLHRREQLNIGIELIIAVTAPSSAVAGLWFWDTSLGSILWRVLGVAAAIAAVIKPILMLPKQIKAYNEVLTGYRTLGHDLFEIKEMIAQKGKYDKELQADYRKALKREGALAVKDPETKQDKALIRKLVKEVNQELPAGQFFVPAEQGNDS